MRIFNSYGPVDPEEHYCVERKKMVDHCARQLVGYIEKGGGSILPYGARVKLVKRGYIAKV